MDQVVVSILALFVAILAFVRALRDHRTFSNTLRAYELRAKDAERLLRERGALASELAHEIKNPITAILCSADALDMLIGNTLSEDHRKCLHYMKEYGDNLLRLVSDFLDLSRLEAGHFEHHPENLRIETFLESIAGLLYSSANQKNIHIRTFVMEENLNAFADSRQVKQVLFNLLHNAIKYTGSNGEIQIVAKSDFPHEMIRVSVRDNGCGIPAHKIADIFDPYTRVGNSQESHTEGFGLGLAVCKALVELQGGRLEVVSEVKVGSCFEFTLPLGHATDQRKDLELPLSDLETGRPFEGRHFLLVDQNTGARTAIAQLIEAWGGMVDQVTQATEAIEAIQRTHYDAAMLDQTRDGMLGHELASLLRQDPNAKPNTIIVAAQDKQDSELALASGADSCLEKPLNGKALLTSLLQNLKFSVTH